MKALGSLSMKVAYPKDETYKALYMMSQGREVQVSDDILANLDEEFYPGIGALSSAQDPTQEGGVLFSESEEKPLAVAWFSGGVDDQAEVRLSVEGVQPEMTVSQAWDKAYRCFRGDEDGCTSMPEENVYYLEVEPEFLLIKSGVQKKQDELQGYLNKTPFQGAAVDTSIRNVPFPVWSHGGTVGWHLEDDRTGLKSAVKIVRENTPVRKVQYAHLDTGYWPDDPLKPAKINEAKSLSFVSSNKPSGANEEPAKHGAKTLSTLAGRNIKITNEKGYSYDGQMGADPDANIREYRIAKNSVVHLSTKNMTRAINKAIEEEIDVISLSAGGLPSGAQRDAINRAYENGTAIFAATGDFFVFPFTSFTLSPSTLAFPARYNRVIGVAGVTADYKSYGKSDCYWCLARHFSWRNVAAWSMRGSYGPIHAMKGHTISAYSPNITHSVSTDINTALVDMTGGGTSHATPQVAAAAGLWLEYHSGEFNGAEWRSWKKTEAVYQALMESAFEPEKTYSINTMGAGVLRAKDALIYSTNQLNVKPRKKSSIGFLWIADMVASWDLIRLLIPAQVDWWISGYHKMVNTEISQLVSQSEKLNKFLSADKTESSLSSYEGFVVRQEVEGLEQSDTRCSPEEINAKATANDFAKLLLKEENISKTLTDILNAQIEKNKTEISNCRKD